MPYANYKDLVILQQQNGLMDSTLPIARNLTVQAASEARQNVEDNTI